MWNVHTGKCSYVLRGHTDEVKVIQCALKLPLPDLYASQWFAVQCIYMVGSLAVSGSWDTTLRIWELMTGVCRCTLVGHTEGKEMTVNSLVGGPRSVS